MTGSAHTLWLLEPVSLCCECDASCPRACSIPVSPAWPASFWDHLKPLSVCGLLKCDIGKQVEG